MACFFHSLDICVLNLGEPDNGFGQADVRQLFQKPGNQQVSLHLVQGKKLLGRKGDLWEQMLPKMAETRGFPGLGNFSVSNKFLQSR